VAPRRSFAPRPPADSPAVEFSDLITEPNSKTTMEDWLSHVERKARADKDNEVVDQKLGNLREEGKLG
jgi:hypothetical protein